MNLDNLGGFSDWKEDPDEGEGWKQKPTRIACKALYSKWNEIMVMLTGALGTLKEVEEEEDDAFTKDVKNMLLSDAYEVGIKIKTSESGGSMYILRMEHAAIIRKNAEFIRTSMLTLMMEGGVDEEYGETIRAEIDEFRALFIKWIGTFEKDEYTDEWGLFI